MQTPKHLKTGSAAGISFGEYRGSLLALDQHLNDNMQDAVLQNANFMSLVITFVFLFEMNFIAGVFPDAVSSIDYNRYSCCLSLLMCANGLLVLALALLLKVTDCVRSPFLGWEYHFRFVDEHTTEKVLAERKRALQYGINRVTREYLLAASRVITIARRYTLGGMLVGALSAIMFIVNGKVLNDVVGDLQGNGSLWLGARAWTVLGLASLVVCFLLYFWSSRKIRGLASGFRYGTSVSLFDKEVKEYLRCALPDQKKPEDALGISRPSVNDSSSFSD